MMNPTYCFYGSYRTFANHRWQRKFPIGHEGLRLLPLPTPSPFIGFSGVLRKEYGSLQNSA
jgi:hypothetical protein